MSDEAEKQKDSQSEQKEDQFGNLKAEMNRKLSNTETQMAELKKLNEDLLYQVSNMTQSTKQKQAQQMQQEEQQSLSDLWYDNPAKAAEIIEKRTEERINQRLNQAQAQQQKVNKILGSLVSEYPELSDQNNDLTKKTVEIYESLPDDEKQSPLAYKVAARDAAAELGVLPRSKRKDAASSNADNFSFGGSGSSPVKRRDSDDIPDATKAFAKAMGLDVSDEKILGRMKATYKQRERKTEKFS